LRDKLEATEDHSMRRIMLLTLAGYVAAATG
jgi:hypothetical protein